MRRQEIFYWTVSASMTSQINKRDVHTVFQSYALFPHMNVFENVAFPLRLRKIDKKEIEKRVAEVLKMVQLEGYEKRSIRKLSGGTTSACSHCPCYHQPTRVVLLDEPLSALDLKLRTDMQYELRGIATTIGHYLCLCHSRSGRSPGHE